MNKKGHVAAIGKAEYTLKSVKHKLPKLSHYTTELGNQTYGLKEQDHNLVNNQTNQSFQTLQPFQHIHQKPNNSTA